MQKQERQDRQQNNNPMAYSPDYSSPYSPQSMLPARFDQNSPRQQSAADKENQVGTPLPIFQDRPSQMMTGKVIVANMNAYNEVVLSDTSDEQLIQQLQLNREDKPTLLHSTNIQITQSNSNTVSTTDEVINQCASQPFHNRTNSMNTSKPQSSRHAMKQQPSIIENYSTNNSNVVAQPRQSVPQPHPYPISTSRRSSNNSSVAGTSETMQTEQIMKQSSPAISEEISNHHSTKQFVASSVSSTCETQKKQRVPETPIQVKQFHHTQKQKKTKYVSTQNSTIEEQPSEEQLQASGTVSRNKRHKKRATAISAGHHTQRSIHDKTGKVANSNYFDDVCNRRSVPEPQIINSTPTGRHEDITNQNFGAPDHKLVDIHVESESMMQVRLLSEATSAMQRGNIQIVNDLDYSPSGSMEDLFSPNGQQKQKPKLDSPMVNKSERRSQGAEESDMQPTIQVNTMAITPDVVTHQEHQIQMRPGSCRPGVKSPIRQRRSLYGQISTPSEQLYKPILRGSSHSGSKMTTVAPMSVRRSAQIVRSRINSRSSLSKKSPSPNSNSRATSPSGSLLKRTSLNKALSNMMHKPTFTMRSQSREVQHILSESRRQKSLFARQSPSPAQPMNRTRNGIVQKATSSNLKQTSSQKSLQQVSSYEHQHKPQQQLAPAVDFNRTIQTPVRRNLLPTAKSPTIPRPYHNNNTNGNSKRYSDMLDQQYQQHLATLSTLNPKSQLTMPTRTSLYQIRRVIDGMRALDIQMFIELERIKKPTAAVLAITRMSCIFFEALRQRDPIRMDQVETMQSWSQIQQYMSDQLMCCVPELRTLLKKKIIALSLPNEANQISSDNIALIKASMEKINETFFTESKMRVIRRFTQTGKLMKQLVSLIHAFVCLAIDLERDYSAVNLLKLTEQPIAKFEDVKQLLENVPFNVSISRSSHKVLQNESTKNFSKNLSQEQLLEVDTSIKTDPGSKEQSVCSKCSCHLRQSQQSVIQPSRVSISIGGDQQLSLLESAEQVKYVEESPEAKFEMQNQVFRTLETMYVEKKQSFNEQAYRKSAKHQSEDCCVEVPEVPSPSQFLSVKNYTTVQLPKPSQKKVRISSTDDLQGVMSISETSSKDNKKALKQNKPVEGNQRQLSKSQMGRNSRRQFSLAHMTKLSQPKHKNQRKESVSSRGDFVSVVRASTTITTEEPIGRQTPKLRSSITPTRPEPTGATTRRQARSKAQTAPAIQQIRKDVSPVTPKPYLRRAQKNKENTSQRRLSTISVLTEKPKKEVEPKPQQSKTHVRSSTLFKSTASAAARQVQAQRESSSKGFSKNQPQQSHKTKSQTLKRQSTSQTRQVGGIKQITTTATQSQPKKQFLSRNNVCVTTRNITASDLAEFVATEAQIKKEQSGGLEAMPSFGGASDPDIPIVRIVDNLGTTRTARAPPSKASFTPVKKTMGQVLDNNLDLPMSHSQNMNAWFSNNQQEISQQPNDSLDDHELTIDERQKFIMDKAQAITENINSCYRQHNMPQIDMATIQRLKMRRMQMMHVACKQGDRMADSESRGISRRPTTEHSLENVQPYRTIENHGLSDRNSQKDEHSFVDALNKLKVEVESLMQHRQKH